MRSIFIVGVLAIGCSAGPPAVVPPTYNPAAIAAKAMELFDKNHDGQLDDAELAACPGLKAAKAAFDTDKNGKISAAEITDRFKRYVDAQPDLSNCGCVITLAGRPLVGATVKLIPEPFLPGLSVAEGTTDESGAVSLQVAGQPMPGLFCGLYRVEIRGPGVPERFNDKTELGCEVPPSSFSRGVVKLKFELTMK